MRLTEQEICALAMESAKATVQATDDPAAYARQLHSHYCKAKECLYRIH